MTQCKIFISYSHNDDSFRKDLETHLTPMKLSGLAINWSDSKIIPGKDFWSEIDNNLNNSAVIILMISPDYLASESCRHEMNSAIELIGKNKCYIIPVILRYCDWEDLPVRKYLSANYDAKPISSFFDRDLALFEIVKEIKKTVNEWIDNNATSENIPNSISASLTTSDGIENTIAQAISEKFEMEGSEKTLDNYKPIKRHQISAHSEWNDFKSQILDKLYELSNSETVNIRPWGDKYIIDIYKKDGSNFKRFIIEDVGGQIGKPGFQLELYHRANIIPSSRYRLVETGDGSKYLKNVWIEKKGENDPKLYKPTDFAAHIWNILSAQK